MKMVLHILKKTLFKIFKNTVFAKISGNAKRSQERREEGRETDRFWRKKQGEKSGGREEGQKLEIIIRKTNIMHDFCKLSTCT